MLRRSKADKGGRRESWEPHGEGVLLVCDDPDAGELLDRLMAQDGHDVHRVETAEGAIRHLLATPRQGAVLSLSGPTGAIASGTRKRTARASAVRNVRRDPFGESQT